MSLEKEKTEIPCPGGGNPIKTTYGQLASKSKLKSNKGHEYHFKHSDQSKLKNAMKKMESGPVQAINWNRMIDGKEAVQFLATVKQLLEEPVRILLEI